MTMAELLKHIYTPKRIQSIAHGIQQQQANFSIQQFIDLVFDQHWHNLELKARQAHISFCFSQLIEGNYLQQLDIICRTAALFGNYSKKTDKTTPNKTEVLGNFEYMIFPTFVEMYGIEYPELFDENMQALEHLTQYSSSEFAIRPFILQNPTKTMSVMLAWSSHENYHVRRLASEGCRPKLPWAMALKPFQKDPSLILPILDNLKADNSLYVRRSVANNLNDISKDHPQQVLSLAQQWSNTCDDTNWLIKHGLRSLLKQGNTQALDLFGFSPPKHIQCSEITCDNQVKIGDSLTFSAQLNTPEIALGKCRIEFAINFMKANGKQNTKVFKISESDIQTQQKSIQKTFSFKAISTRKYYLGKHDLSIIVNGVTLQCCPFQLIQ